MANIKINGKNFDILKQDEKLLINSDISSYDIISLPDGTYNLVLENKSYTIKILDKNTSSGELSLSINGRTINTKLENKLTALLKSMGMESGKKKLKDLKAPMPGLVLDTLVKAGEEVSEGQDLLVLEAMKMENVIKSPQAGTIEAIIVQKHDKVEKNQVLLSFE